jgi:hypothetical protein
MSTLPKFTRLGVSVERHYVKHVCKIGQGHDCCRYLGGSKDGFVCMKHSEFKNLLDTRVIEETIVARGDNCDGFDFDDKTHQASNANGQGMVEDGPTSRH